MCPEEGVFKKPCLNLNTPSVLMQTYDPASATILYYSYVRYVSELYPPKGSFIRESNLP